MLRQPVIVRHILPNLITPLLTLAALDVPRNILTESGLSFLGFGIQPPDSSWGLMLAQGRQYIITAWWVVVMPGMAIFLTALSFNLFGVWMRAVSDPLAALALAQGNQGIQGSWRPDVGSSNSFLANIPTNTGGDVYLPGLGLDQPF